jgi:hypothetical protein
LNDLITEVEEIHEPIYPLIEVMNVMEVREDVANCEDNPHQQQDHLVRRNQVVVVVHGKLTFQVLIFNI